MKRICALALLAHGCYATGASDAMSAMPREDVGLPVLGLLWTFPLHDQRGTHLPQEFASAVVEEEQLSEARLYVGSHAGFLYALSSNRGEEVFRLKIGAVSGRPVKAGNQLFVGTDDGSVFCLDVTTRKQLWRYASQGAVLRPPVVTASRVIVANEAGEILALDRASGGLQWRFAGDEPGEFVVRGHAGIAVAGDLLFTGLSTGAVVALNVTSGAQVWSATLTETDGARFVDVDSTPVVDGDTVFVSAGTGVYAIDTTTGLVRWRTALRNPGPVVVDGDRIFVGAADFGVYALDRAGNTLWRQGTRGGGEFGDVQVSGDYVLYSLTDAGLFVADKATGRLLQFFDPGMGISAAMTVWGDRLYVVSNGGILYAFALRRFE